MEFIYIAALAGLAIVIFFWIVFLRRVVPTNEVHIVQSGKRSISYGVGIESNASKEAGADLKLKGLNGNTYYEFPSWIPIIGVLVSKYPVSVFAEELIDYEAYDQGRLPFVIDVKAFFRISDSEIAARRVSSFSEMRSQLNAILQGCIRSILATNSIESIMQDRAKFGEAFTQEVDDNLRAWGVSTVKSVELMDIRDSVDSHVIKNIMDKKKSQIEMESRTEVAQNNKKAQIAEIEAQRETDVKKQEALQQVGLRTAEKEREVGIANEQATQVIAEQQKITKEKEMSILQVAQVNQAEIDKQVKIVEAEKEKATTVINAEANKQTTVIDAEAQKQSALIRAEGEKTSTVMIADGNFQSKTFESKGIEAEGAAKANAEKLMQLASVEAEITLAEKIGNNESYQKYLVSLKQVEVMGSVGIEQAKALEKANVKIIANGGNVSSGLNSVTDLFSSNGGTQLGSMLEGLAQTEAGKAIVDKITSTKNKSES
jgi:flotillin